MRHLLKLVWNRKRTNLLVMAEIFFSFLVLFGVITAWTFYVDNYRQPLGYDYGDVWQVDIDMKQEALEVKDPAMLEATRRLAQAVAELPPVQAVAGCFTVPYDDGAWSTDYRVDGRRYRYEIDTVDDAFAEVLGLRVTRGRWFSREDDAAGGFDAVVINERLARHAFGDGDPIGRALPQDPDRSGKPRTERRVVGVVEDYRAHGEFEAPTGYLFLRTSSQPNPPRRLLLKVRPGTPAAFEEALMARLQAGARDWSFRIVRLEERRAANHRERLAPMIAAGVVAGFLLLMVALGLTGVLWQNVTQRTREIGLRRAKGATAVGIHRQILGEVVVMTSLAVALGVLVVAQFPLLDLLGFVRPGVFAASLAVSCLALYVLTV
ncbi:MAG TPA: ABC transporter permease, partial [Vicinamibacteria bacterium]